MKTKRLVVYSLLIAMALVLSFVEILIPNPFPIPGVKVGLANIVTVFALMEFNPLTAIAISIIRILLAGFLFGSVSSIIYSLSGLIFSLLIMVILKRLNFHIYLISISGGIFHNIGQLIMACLVTKTPSLFYSYFPILFVSGFLTGLFIGFICKYFLKYYDDLDLSKML